MISSFFVGFNPQTLEKLLSGFERFRGVQICLDCLAFCNLSYQRASLVVVFTIDRQKGMVGFRKQQQRVRPSVILLRIWSIVIRCYWESCCIILLLPWSWTEVKHTNLHSEFHMAVAQDCAIPWFSLITLKNKTINKSAAGHPWSAVSCVHRRQTTERSCATELRLLTTAQFCCFRCNRHFLRFTFHTSCCFIEYGTIIMVSQGPWCRTKEHLQASAWCAIL